MRCEGQTAKLPVVHDSERQRSKFIGERLAKADQTELEPKFCRISQKQGPGGIIQGYAEVFREGLGTLEGMKATLYEDPEITPKFFRARPVSHSLKEKVDRELDRLRGEGTIEAVQFAKWAAPIVPVLKSDGSVRICGDYRVTVNQTLIRDKYPLPRIEDLFSTLTGGKTFTKFDLSQAYQQVLLEEEAKQYLTSTGGCSSTIQCHLECHQHRQYFKESWTVYCKTYPGL